MNAAVHMRAPSQVFSSDGGDRRFDAISIDFELM